MKKIIIDDEFLYEYVTNAANLMLEKIPEENDIEREFSEEFLKKMNILVKKTKAKQFTFYAKRTAVLILVVLTISFAAAMSVEAYRTRLFNTVVEIWDDFTSLLFKNEEDKIINEKLIPTESDYIPSGYSISERNTTDYINLIFYKNNDCEEIIYKQKKIVNDSFIIDTENAEIEKIIISTQELVIIKNKGIYQIYWCDDMYVYQIMGNVEKRELLNMAENIIKKK